MNLKLLDVVCLTNDVPARQLKKGQQGTIVHVFTSPRLAFGVEFTDENGATIAQFALGPDEIEPAG